MIDVAANRAVPIDPALRAEIADMEDTLRVAMLTSDVKALDRLLSERLFFTSHLGRLVTKESDLETHRAGRLRLRRLELSERRMMEVAGVVVVTALADLAGSYDGDGFAGRFRYTRVWSRDRIGRWQVVAGQASAIAPG